MGNSAALLARHTATDPLFVETGRVVTAGDASARARALVEALDALRADELVLGTAVRDRVATAFLAAALSGRILRIPSATEPRPAIAASGAGRSIVVHAGEHAEGLDLRDFDTAPASTVARLVAHPDASVLFHTSGSTGRPKPLSKSVRVLVDESEMHVGRLGLVRGTSIVATVPSTHLYGFLFAVVVPLLAGGRVAIPAPMVPPAIAELMGAEACDVLVSVPAHLRAFHRLLPASLPRRPRIVLSSGAPLADSDAVALSDALACDVEEILGSTETGGLGVRRAGERGFAPLPGVCFLGIEDGSLRVSSSYLEPGGSAITTQDRGTLERGRFVHEGRSDGVVKIAGTRVSIAEIEDVLRGIEGVTEAIVRASSGSASHGTRLSALVESTLLDASAVRRLLVARLPAIAIPKRVVVVRELPRGPSGKVSDGDVDRHLRRPSVRLVPDGGPGSYRVEVPTGSPAFDGHFPGRPILPGLVQLRDVVLAAARLEWPGLPHPTRISRVKFKQPVAPGAVLSLRLTRNIDSRVQFALAAADAEVASGVFHFD